MDPGSNDYGTVIDHTDRIRIDEPEFVVQPAGLKRYRATGKRNVHAFVRGEVDGVGDDADFGEYRAWAFDYRPRDPMYEHLTRPFVFYDVPEGQPVGWVNPDKVLLTPSGRYGLFDYSVDLGGDDK